MVFYRNYFVLLFKCDLLYTNTYIIMLRVMYNIGIMLSLPAQISATNNKMIKFNLIIKNIHIGLKI